MLDGLVGFLIEVAAELMGELLSDLWESTEDIASFVNERFFGNRIDDIWPSAVEEYRFLPKHLE